MPRDAQQQNNRIYISQDDTMCNQLKANTVTDETVQQCIHAYGSSVHVALTSAHHVDVAAKR